MRTKPKKKIPARASDLPVNNKMLMEVRNDLRSDIRSLEHKTKAGFLKMESRFHSIDSRFDAMESRFHSIDSRFDSMESSLHKINSQLEKMMSKIHQTNVLVEGQNVLNKFALDGLTGYTSKNQELDDRLTHVEKRLGVFR